MNEEKQIEEMQKTLIKISEQPIMIEGLLRWSDVIAEELYNAGYRKQREARYCADPNYRTLGNCGDCGGDVTCLNKYCPNCGARMGGENT